MVKAFLGYTEEIFDKIYHYWESQNTNRIISKVLVMIFVGITALSFLEDLGVPVMTVEEGTTRSIFYAIELTFTILLIFELLSLIFVLPNSVSKSVAKQLELLSLIFLRGTFKEFSHITDFSWQGFSESVINMAYYTGGALFIFIVMGLSSIISKERFPISTNPEKNRRFIQAKKFIALLLLVFAIGMGSIDIYGYFTGTLSSTNHTFHKFYTLLIFSDILIVLIALRYTMNYYKIFRYSSFVVATIFIRMALSSEMYYNIILGCSVAVFVLLLNMAYYYFSKKNLEL
jgi:hypothetical protein